MDLDQHISPLIENLALSMNSERLGAVNGDGMPVPVSPDFLHRLQLLVADRGLGKSRDGSAPEQQVHYFVPESVIAHPQARQLGLATNLHTFNQFLSGETVFHEQIHRKIAKALGQEILQDLGTPHDVEEAVCFAMEIALFGNEKDVARILSKPPGVAAGYSYRTSYLTYQFVRIYHMSGSANMLQFVRDCSKALRENKDWRLEDLLLLGPKEDLVDVIVEKIKRKAHVAEIPADVAAGTPEKVTFHNITWAKNLTDRAKIKDAYIVTYFMDSFGLDEATAMRIIDRQEYKDLREAVTDLSLIKINAINATNRLKTLFFLSTAKPIDEVRQKVGKVMGLHMDARILHGLHGMNDTIAQLYEAFGSDTVAAFMDLAMHSITLAEEMGVFLIKLVKISSHNRRLTREFMEKLVYDKDFRVFLLLKGGLKYLSEGLSTLYDGEYGEVGSTSKDAQRHVFQAMLKDQYGWGPKISEPAYDDHGKLFTGYYSWFTHVIRNEVPLEVQDDLLPFIPRLGHLTLLGALLTDKNLQILATQCEEKGLEIRVSKGTKNTQSGTGLRRGCIDGWEVFKRIVLAAKTEVQKSGGRDYSSSCTMLVSKVEEKVRVLEECLEKLLADPETKKSQK